MGFVAQGFVELVEPEVPNVPVAEEVRVDLFGMGTSAGKPEAQGGVAHRLAEEQLDIGHGAAKIASHEDAPDISGGGVETLEGGAPAAGEAFLAGLALELWDRCCPNRHRADSGRPGRRCRCAYVCPAGFCAEAGFNTCRS